MSYNTLHKAAIAFSKLCHDTEMIRASESKVKPNRKLMGASRYKTEAGESFPVILNGYYGVYYDFDLPDLVETGEDATDIKKKMEFESLSVRDQYDYRMAEFPKLKDLRELWSQERKRCVGHVCDRNVNYRLISGSNEAKDNVIVSLPYLINLMELCDCKGGESFSWRNGISPIYCYNVLNYFSEFGNKYVTANGILFPRHVFDKCLNDD